MDNSAPSQRKNIISKATAPTSGDRAWKVAQLAATITSREHHGVGPSVSRNLMSKTWDIYFAAALKRAEVLLDWAEGKVANVHAYQLFREGELLTIAEIADVFKSFNWEGLRSKQPVIDLLKTLHEKFESIIKRSVEEMDKVDKCGTLIAQEIDDSIVKAFTTHIWDPCDEEASSWNKKTCSEIRGVVAEIIAAHIQPPTEQELRSSSTWEDAFFGWCFLPQVKGVRRYRAYEIFKRCAAEGWYSEKLIRSFKGGLVPHPPSDLPLERYPIFQRDCPHLPSHFRKPQE